MTSSSSDTVNVVCVQKGNYLGRGSEYVNILRDQVMRSTTRPHRFICFTDDPSGLDEGIEARKLPEGLNGWWNKLYLFSKEAGLTGRVVFFDLDTVIVGSLDEIFDYRGPFAILRDFYRKDGYGSGVMAWDASRWEHVWENWLEAGKPELPGGDQVWMEQALPKADIWQDLYPGKFVSYKVHATEWPPNGTSVVCFHGEPRPHDAPSPWVQQVWKKQGLAPIVFQPGMNVTRDEVVNNIRENIKRDIPWQAMHQPHTKRMVLAAGGPSLRASLNDLRLRKSRGHHLWTMNNTHDFLIERGIIPNFHILMDAREKNIAFLRKPRKDVVYFIASRCHPSIFGALEGYQVVMWHSLIMDSDGVDKEVSAMLDGKPWCMVGGGGTVGLRALNLGWQLGYRHFHLYGYDSCYADDKHHAYPQVFNDGERTMEVYANGRKFICAPWMAQQARDFQTQAKRLVSKGGNVSVHGQGLIPFIASHL